MTPITDKPPRANYDGAIVLFSAALLIVVVGGGVYLVSLAVGAAPVVASIFGIMLVLMMCAGVGLFVVQQRWAINRISEVTANTARDMSAALIAYKSQSPPAAGPPMLYAEPARAQIADIRRTFNNGLPPGVSGARVSDGANEYIASTASLVAALDLLAEGKDPTRSNFREKGIMSSTEVAGAVNLLASLGYVSPVVQGAPAEWAASVVPADVSAIADHMRGYVPALPVYEPVFAEIAPQAGQAGSKAGRGKGRRP